MLTAGQLLTQLEQLRVDGKLDYDAPVFVTDYDEEKDMEVSQGASSIEWQDSPSQLILITVSCEWSRIAEAEVDPVPEETDVG